MIKTQSDMDRPGYAHVHHDGMTSSDAIKTTLLNRICWGAVLAGVVVAFSIQVVLNLLGVGIGLTTLNAFSGSEANMATAFSWGAAIWGIIAGILAAYGGGFAAGRLAGEPKKSTASWHGLISWATSVFLLAILVTSTAGMATRMGSPFQMSMNQPSSLSSTNNNASDTATVTTQNGTTAGNTTAANNDAVTVNTQTMATLALVSAVMMILGAAAAWFGGRAGTCCTMCPNGNTYVRDDKIVKA